jgi:hypothetical protein
MTSLTLVPQDCPIFQICNASLCPLDPDWPWTTHLPGEQICRYLLASGKEGAAQYYQNDPTFAACLTLLNEVCVKHADIARGVERASKSGFRGRNLRKHMAGASHEPCGTEVAEENGPDPARGD